MNFQIAINILFVIYIFVSIALYIKKNNELKSVISIYIKTSLQNKVLEDAFQNLKTEYDALKLAGNNDFVKFLTDSRESAFDYIEKVQEVMFEIKKASDNKDRKEVTAKTKELLKLLPEQNIPNN